MSFLIFYAPLLHREAAPGKTPRDVAFFPVGLPERDAGEERAGEAARAARTLAGTALPLTGAEASAVLDEMLSLGKDYAADGLLRQMAAAVDAGKAASEASELAALASFAEGAASTERVPDWGADERRAALLAPAITQAVMNCQKVLLLIYALEERSLELMRLECRFAAAQNALASALGEDAGLVAGSAEAGFAAASDDQDGVFEAPVAWRTALEAMLPFLPDRALLFTNDERMTLDLRDKGMLRPFPEDRAARLAGWPVELTSGLLYAQLPAYRLVGRKSPPPERPWLSREIEVLAARPVGGWANAGEDG